MPKCTCILYTCTIHVLLHIQLYMWRRTEKKFKLCPLFFGSDYACNVELEISSVSCFMCLTLGSSFKEVLFN